MATWWLVGVNLIGFLGWRVMMSKSSFFVVLGEVPGVSP